MISENWTLRLDYEFTEMAWTERAEPGDGGLRVAMILGKRPEIIKMSSIIRECMARGLDCLAVDKG